MGSPRPGLRARIVGLAGAWLILALGSTWRTRLIGAEHLASCRAGGRGFAYGFWHGLLLPIAYLNRGQRATVLVSLHRDGEYIAQAARRLGIGSVRGSSSRGGARSLLEMVRLGRRGEAVAFTPDGPRGPRRRVQPGLPLCAQRAGIPILPIAAAARPCRRLGSWDRFLVPAPFARVVLAYGPPLAIPAGIDRQRMLALWTPRIEEALDAAERAAQQALDDWDGRPRRGAPPRP
ncbi:MAG: lysophospholipid acyltransferase family protein [Candidatus Eisenbacteria bacterium]|uniref:Lysophospholipid acyltransferase family protein n=1 Tax=Eiseniibacteriota bacterium TaxID=2212470 RepID=A0A937X9I4_UNCEI|nr:lysophospholipid acyltransferase family protein [Candidatus Eisenbacteria bacterium]